MPRFFRSLMSGPGQLCILSSSYLIFGCRGGTSYRQQVPPSSCHHSLRFRLLLRCRRLTRRRDMSNRACWLCMWITKWVLKNMVTDFQWHQFKWHNSTETWAFLTKRFEICCNSKVFWFYWNIQKKNGDSSNKGRGSKWIKSKKDKENLFI